MRLLVDSNVLLWWLQGTRTLPSVVTTVMSDGANELVMSVASVWELAIKESMGKLRIDEDLRDCGTVSPNSASRGCTAPRSGACPSTTGIPSTGCW